MSTKNSGKTKISNFCEASTSNNLNKFELIEHHLLCKILMRTATNIYQYKYEYKKLNFIVFIHLLYKVIHVDVKTFEMFLMDCGSLQQTQISTACLSEINFVECCLFFPRHRNIIIMCNLTAVISGCSKNTHKLI